MQMRERWKRSSALLDSLSPLRVVDRGYAIVTHQESIGRQERVVKDAAGLQVGDLIKLRFAKGSAEAEVKKIITDNTNEKVTEV
jgi:exodeoxyribonuclease VII large subunit